MSKHVAVLLGGLSAEREVSLRSGAAMAKACRDLGYKTTEIDVGRDIAQVLAETKPDVALIALHGTYGEDGCVQGVCELLQIPYSHSGLRASAVAMDKPMAKQLFKTVGIDVPRGLSLTPAQVLTQTDIPKPFVVKPVDEGSSIGLLIIQHSDNESLEEKMQAVNFRQDQMLLVEEFVQGKELTIAVVNGKALAVLEIRPHRGFYDYTNKYTAGNTEYIVPAPIPADIYQKALEMSEKAYAVLGCRGVARTDIRYDDSTGRLAMLEINTHPGMTATSLVPKIAAHAGIGFTQLVEQMVQTARLDHSVTKEIA